MDLELTGRRAVVTGATRGIGLAMATEVTDELCAVDILVNCAARVNTGPMRDEDSSAPRRSRLWSPFLPVPGCINPHTKIRDLFNHDFNSGSGPHNLVIGNEIASSTISLTGAPTVSSVATLASILPRLDVLGRHRRFSRSSSRPRTGSFSRFAGKGSPAGRVRVGRSRHTARWRASSLACRR